MEKEKILDKENIFMKLPPIWSQSLMDEIKAFHEQSAKRLVVLDDDPTGTQTVHDIPLITEWSVTVLEKELRFSNTFFILTNTRSLSETDAAKLNREIGQNLKTAADNVGVDFFVLSRSDSTLRGHFPAEVDALCQGIEYNPDAVVLAPYFGQGGRYTIADTHYVHIGDELVPASLTEFAKDKSFSFNHSYLPKYVQEKTKGRMKENDVFSIDIETIRVKGPEGVYKKLMSFPDKGVIIINSTDDRDIEVAVKGLQMAQEQNKKYIYRTAASFVSVLAGIRSKPLLDAISMRIKTETGGVMFVGSHVKKSTEQLEKALLLPNIIPVEIDVEELLDNDNLARLVGQYSIMINKALSEKSDVVAYTSRKLIATNDPNTSLEISRRVSEVLVQLVKKLSVQPKFLIAKGGITSNDIATKGLAVKRAMVVGQLQPGIPVWQLGKEAKFPKMHYVVYPGNVGTSNGLSEAITAFRKTN